MKFRVILEDVVNTTPWKTRVLGREEYEDEDEAEEAVESIVQRLVMEGYNCEGNFEMELRACRKNTDESGGGRRVISEICVSPVVIATNFCIKNNDSDTPRIKVVRLEYGDNYYEVIPQFLERLGLKELIHGIRDS